MGFPEQWCRKALGVTGGNVDAAANFVMANMDEPEAFWNDMPAEAPAGAGAAAAGEREQEEWDRSSSTDQVPARNSA